VNLETVKYDRVCHVFDSDNVETISYSIESKIFLVRFSNTSEYRYYNVPMNVWTNVVGAPSIGKAFNHFVSKSDFSYERVDI
jgi:hypothetical protein